MRMGENNIFKVLSDSQRREILVMLKGGRLSAGEIAEKTGHNPGGAFLSPEASQRRRSCYGVQKQKLYLLRNQYLGF